MRDLIKILSVWAAYGSIRFLTTVTIPGSGPGITLWATDLSGHRSYYLRLLLEYLRTRENKVQIIFLEDSDKSGAIIQECRDSFSYRGPVESGRRSLWSLVVAHSDYFSFRKGTTNISLDGDQVFPLFLLAGITNLRVLLIRSPNVLDSGFSAIRTLKKLLISVAEFFGTRFLHLVHPWQENLPKKMLVTDPSPFLLLRPQSLVPMAPKHDELFKVGVFGSIDRRKNLRLLIRAASLGPRVQVAVFGKWSSSLELEETMRLADSNGVQLSVENRSLTDEELREAMASVSGVAVMNQNEGSSGIAIGAVQLGVPLIMAGSASMNAIASSVGAIWGGNTVEEFADALRRLMAEGGTSKKAYSEDIVSRIPSIRQFAEAILSGSG